MLRRRRTSTSGGCRLGEYGDPRRQDRINAVLADAARRLDAGESLEQTDIEREHDDLMPELGRRLRDLHILRQAAEQARQADEEVPPDPRDAFLTEELTVLRQSLADYEVLSRVRYGGQGVVYRARQRGTNRMVALKFLLDGPLATERQRHLFEREIELVSRLRHPNIVTVYESGCVRGRLFCAMEFITGLPIDDYVILHDLGPREIVALAIKVCRAVYHAHVSGIIHRDLKPANILVDDQGEPRVYDFGLGKDLWAGDGPLHESCTSLGVGTLPYLSPEQAGGLDGKTDVRSDVYAIGVVLYQLLTDAFPYPVGGEAVAVRNVIIATEPMPLRKASALGGTERAPEAETIDRDLEAILARTLAKRKDERYQSADDLADDLERWLRGEAVAARAGSRLYALRKTVRRHAVAFSIAGVVLAAATLSSIVVTASWLRVRQERDSARQAARVAYGLFDVALTDVEESVRPLAGGVAVRDRLIQRLSTKMPELQTLSEADQALDPVRTRLLEKEGDIALQQGRRDDARRLYQGFLDGSVRRAQSPSNGNVPRSDVIRAYRKLAEVLDDRAGISEKGIAYGEETIAGAPDDEEARYELCRLLVSYGGFIQDAGHQREALMHYERALALCPTIGGPKSAAGRWALVEAQARSGQGLALHMLGEGARAEEAMLRGLELRQQAVATAPANTDARLSLVWSYTHVGTLFRDAGKPELAREYLQKAAEQADFLAELDPTCTVWEGSRYGVHHRLAALCAELGQLDEAKTHCQQALAIAQAEVGRDEGADSLSTLAHALRLQGRIAMAESAWAAARETLTKALSIRQTLLDKDPSSPVRLADVIAVHQYLSTCCRGLGELPGQLRHQQAAYDLRRRLVGLQPDAVSALLGWIGDGVSLALAHMDFRTPEHDAAAEQLLAEAKAALDGLVRADKLQGWEKQSEIQAKVIRETQAALRGRSSVGSGSVSGASEPR